MDDSTVLSGQDPMDDAAQQVKETAADMAHSAKDSVTREANAAVQRVAGSADNLASTLRNAADAASEDNEWLGNLLSKSAESVERATSSLSAGDFSAVVDDVNGFARRQPAIFLGLCVAAGFAAARVGKTAIEQSQASANDGMGNQ